MAIQKEWKIQKSDRKCSACRNGFQVGQKYFSAIYPLAGGGMFRRDFCLSCWPRFRDGAVPPLDAPDGDLQPLVTSGEYLFYWKTFVPEPASREKPFRFDPHVALAVFQNLSDTRGDPEKERLRFIVALSLVRHKLLKLRNIERRDVGSVMVLAARAGDLYEVKDPGVSEQEMLSLMGKIGQLLEIQLDGGDADAGPDNEGGRPADVLTSDDVPDGSGADGV
ncbi:MAG: hypothetical protein JW909_09555 [Planctomycetes bacterium]|nr:hypothetical protein [Planctomycetota bacterium]